MKTIKLSILLLLFSSSFTFAQSSETDTLLQAELSKLKFMEGQWEGHGWMYDQTGTRHEFTQTEDIQFKVDSTTLLIEGIGKSDGKIVHNAMAIISYDKEKGHYNFHSYMANGMSGDFKAELIEDKLYWYPIDFIRYIIFLNDQGQWYEKGEIKRGESWMQFFEMTLNKK